MITAIYSIGMVLALFGTVGCLLLRRLCVAAEVLGKRLCVAVEDNGAAVASGAARLCHAAEEIETETRRIRNSASAAVDILQREVRSSFEDLGSLGSLGNS